MSSPRVFRTVLLDNEPVQALLDVEHRKHRRTLAIIESIAARSLTAGREVALVVPTAIRVEAGWNRHLPTSAIINRLRVHDFSLDSQAADNAAQVRSDLSVSIADAHLAAALNHLAGPHAVVTSDVNDLQRIASHLGFPVVIVAL